MQNLTYWYMITQLFEVYDVSITTDVSIIWGHITDHIIQQLDWLRVFWAIPLD